MQATWGVGRSVRLGSRGGDGFGGRIGCDTARASAPAALTCFPSTNSFVTLSVAYAHAGAVESRGAFSTNAPRCASSVPRSLIEYSCAQAGASGGGMRCRHGGAATRRRVRAVAACAAGTEAPRNTRLRELARALGKVEVGPRGSGGPAGVAELRRRADLIRRALRLPVHQPRRLLFVLHGPHGQAGHGGSAVRHFCAPRAEMSRRAERRRQT